MKNDLTTMKSLHKIETIIQGDLFLSEGKPCHKIGQIKKGVLRGHVVNHDGDEITTHFYQEGDMIIGSFLPNVAVSMTIQALNDCEISIANYAEVMSQVNVNPKITSIINREFEKLNTQSQFRLVSLLNLSALDKYKRFLQDYPNLLNRIPHYYIAQYLGITPTQLSRVRKQFSQQM